MSFDNGHLKIYLGSMFSGKSTELLREINKYKSINKKVLCINHSFDDRYGVNNIVTHNNDKTSAIMLDKLSNLYESEYKKDYEESEVIAINEGQFFDDLLNFVKKSVDQDKKMVIVCGLDGDSDRKPFGQMLDIIPLSDSVVKLHSFCKICNNGTPGIFSKRLDKKNENQILVGATQEYIPVCRKHYNEN